MKERTIRVNLDERSYDIRIGRDAVAGWARQFRQDPGRPNTVCVVTNPTVAGQQRPLLDSMTAALGTSDVHEIPDGEQHKTVQTWEGILSHLLNGQYDRKMAVVAFGGGVVGDIAGFAAAAYRRGVACVQVPTTLLAMVDSSVGGKTAVNHTLGKNMIGAFWQPAEVWIDIATLRTLPDQEFLAGMGEVVKHGFIGGRALFEWTGQHADELLGHNEDVLAECVFRNCQFKARVVEQDEREGGLRSILNYGHTFGHALEAVTEYRAFLHGQAVAHGMRAAGFLARALGRINDEYLAEHNRLVERLCAPKLPGLKADDLVAAMHHDKKVEANRIKLVLARGPGEVNVATDVEEQSIRGAWSKVLDG